MLLPGRGMHRLLFASWVVVSGLIFFVVGLLGFPQSIVIRMLIQAVWVVAVVPFSFALYFHHTRKVEQAYVAQALQAWRAHAADAGEAMARAIDAALFEEDTIALNELLMEVEREPACTEFIAVARVWMNDDRERSLREETLQAARVAAKDVRSRLVQRGAQVNGA